MHEENECNNCQEKPAKELTAGKFNTDLFCSWECLGEYVDELI
jgi:hypothetical protein